MKLKHYIKKINEEHKKAKTKEEYGEVLRKYEEVLDVMPDDVGLQFAIGTVFLQLNRTGIAIRFLEEVTRKKDWYEAWNNLGSCHKLEHRHKESKDCFSKALSLKETADAYNNLSTVYINDGCPEKGVEYALKAIEMEPDLYQARWNLSLMLLEMEDWKKGFRNYEFGLLSGDRMQRFYSENHSDIPYWDGSKGKNIVIYGEQGIGDEIMFASCIPDVIRDSESIIIDAHPRLAKLLARSFPDTPVYGTRKEEYIDWPTGHKIDYRVAIGSLPRFYRKKAEDFPGTPFLKPDKEKVENYKKRFTKPVIGLSWKGGTKKTRSDIRSMPLEELLPILKKDFEFVSLQYTKDAAEEVKELEEKHGIKVHHWPESVQCDDLDEKAALIASLDLVISVCTAAIHMAGALGTPCWIMTPDRPAWRYGLKKDKMIWYNSNRLFRQKPNEKWQNIILEIADELDNHWPRAIDDAKQMG